MKKTAFFLFLIVLVTGFQSAPAAGQQLVSGKMNKLNGFCRIAVNQNSGNGLIVWSQGNAKKNNYGRIYAAELIRQAGGGGPADGSYQIGEPFLVSQTKGSNQRPVVVYLEDIGKYLIAWDTAVYDLSAYVNNRPSPLPSAKILARTYMPGTATGPPGTPGTLGKITTLSDPAFEYNSIANVVPMEAKGAGAAGSLKERVFLTFFCVDEIRDDKVGPYTAGLYGTAWDVAATSDSVHEPLLDAANGEFTRVNGKLMADWSFSYGKGVTVQGFYSGGKVYAAGAHEIWEGGLAGLAGIYKIDSGNLNIDQFFPIAKSKAGQYPINAHGQVLLLNGDVAVSNQEARAVFLTNIAFDLASVDISLAEATLKNLGSVSKKAGEVVDQRLFKISGTQSVDELIKTAAKKSDVYTLYHTNKGQFKYRNLSLDFGKPAGKSKTVLKIKKKRLKWIDVATFGNDLLLGYSEMANKKKYRVYFYNFSLN